jgi:hypothetical protein
LLDLNIKLQAENKKLRDDLFTNEELVSLAKQEEFVSNLICKFQDYGTFK